MNIQQLESFVEVAETLNFARAAESLNLTQSAVSRQIHALEEELGTPLFKRTTRNVTLTPAGIIFLNDAKESLSKLKLSQMKIKNHIENKVDILTLGCTNNAYLSLIVTYLNELNRTFPDIHPIIQITPNRLIINSFLKKEVDLVFSFENEIPLQDDVHFYPIQQIPICIALSNQSNHSNKTIIKIEELTNSNIILCDPHQLPLEVQLKQNQIAKKLFSTKTNFSHDINSMVILIEAGYGFGILPKLAIENISFIPIENSEYLNFGIYYHKKSSPVVNQIIQSIIRKKDNV